MSHHRFAIGAPVAVLTALCLSVGGPAAAIPWPDFPVAPAVSQPDVSQPDVSQPEVETDTTTRPCFLVRSHWNDALDGPQPRCAVR